MDGLKSDLMMFGVGLDGSTFCAGLSPVTIWVGFTSVKTLSSNFTTWSFLSLKYHPSPKKPLEIFMKNYIISLLIMYNDVI